jgi:hypothetical protein
MTKSLNVLNAIEDKASKAMTQTKDGEWVEVVVPGLVEGTLRPGRPVNPNSERQKRLAAMAEKREAGELKRGRPVVADSERQKRLAAMAEKRAAGVEVKRGRPKMTADAVKAVLADLDI